jgi:DedD protein
MSSTPNADTGTTPEDALKRRLLNRIAVAAVMVVGLLGSLAIFDAIYTPRRPPKMAAVPVEAPAAEAETAATTEPKPLEAADVSSVALSAAATAPLSAVASAPATVASATAQTPVPVVAAAPASPPLTTAQVPAAKLATGKPETKAVAEGSSATGAAPLQPLPREKGLTRPATAKPAALRPSEPVAPANSLAARPDPGRVVARAPRASGTPGVAPRAPASRPLSRIAEPHFALQMGVFTNVANAEDLRAKLELHGIPSTIEARVHVGPFATREEADAARAKLKELGLDGGLLVSFKK